MHIEMLIEDSSGAKLIEILLPKIFGSNGYSHTWRLHAYKGIGRLPAGLSAKGDPAKRALLNQLPKVLRGYANASGIDAVIIVIDNDKRNSKEFLDELNKLLFTLAPELNACFCLAVEEMEAWFLGDREALISAYPKAKKDILGRYKQDSICGTWELLADAVYPGGSSKLKKDGWPLPGIVKHDWAEKIGPHMDFLRNESPSFCSFRDNLYRIIS